MEAIDDYANENIVRSIAYTALDYRQQHQYLKLLPISSQLLRQRVHILGPSSSNNQGTTDYKEWDNVVQWQDDNCPAMIETLWAAKGDAAAEELYQRPVYYKRMDADTLHAIIEFADKDTQHFVVVLLLEDGSGDISDIKYHNTKELTKDEWIDVFGNWSRTIEDAERVFLTKVTRNKKVFTAGTPDVKAPEDYWGDWSSDDASSPKQKTCKNKQHPLSADLKELEDDSEEDEYYTRWSKNPGTLTPGPGEQERSHSGRIMQSISQEELNEEYDQSYNPLFTVPSVPNLMDAHTAALSELTHMLQTSLPHQQHQQHEEDISNFTAHKKIVPGAYPESGTHTPSHQYGEEEEKLLRNKEAGRGLFMKSLSALIGAARLLGYEPKDILEMVQEIVNKT
ncbi:hypothetical protein BDF20DRAFT_819744 [Mycotypha africana]|uniref:uncharacterized protein n=1 Tax=Mycotypha africana TaxID=64632 RepID=UPI0023016CBF|nr:uncharacterized protein BDF20DRAFT_819744 [Mycotypha africana]KAI8979529.1 hypothetical protein BDF20DRAFT_819744 [Mycotypha africana]